jgi:two-component system phosphate regulon response regulator OmpR
MGVIYEGSDFGILHPSCSLRAPFGASSAATRPRVVPLRAGCSGVTRLRRKIEVDPAGPEAIRTVRGVGYMFVPPRD